MTEFNTVKIAAKGQHMHLFSRETEHCEENIAALRTLAQTDAFAPDNLSRLLLHLPL